MSRVLFVCVRNLNFVMFPMHGIHVRGQWPRTQDV